MKKRLKKWKKLVGRSVHICAIDHCQNSKRTAPFEIWGRLVEVTKTETVLCTWAWPDEETLTVENDYTTIVTGAIKSITTL